MFIHCLYIYLEFYSAVSKEEVLKLQILHSLRNYLLYVLYRLTENS